MEVKRLKNGELTTAEIKKLIKAHNVAESIKIPKGATRQNILQVLEKAGYVVEHKKAELRPVSKNKVKKLKIIDQKKVKDAKPKPKTELEKQKDMERKQKKELVEKKKVREIKKQAIQQQKEIKKKVQKVEKKIVEKKDIKNKNISNSKAMKQSSKKEDEVRPAKRVRRNPAPVKKVEPTKEPEKNPDKIEGGKIQVIVPSLKGVFESTPKKMYEVLRKKFPKTFKLKKGELEQFGDSVGEKQDGVETLTENIEETMKKMKLFKKYMETFKNLNKEVIEKYGNKTQTNFYELIEDSFIPAPEEIFDVWFKNRAEFKNAGFEPHNITKDSDKKYSIKMNKKQRENFIDTMGGLFNVDTDKIDVKFE